jgi:hypothetical protein
VMQGATFGPIKINHKKHTHRKEIKSVSWARIGCLLEFDSLANQPAEKEKDQPRGCRSPCIQRWNQKKRNPLGCRASMSNSSGLRTHNASAVSAPGPKASTCQTKKRTHRSCTAQLSDENRMKNTRTKGKKNDPKIIQIWSKFQWFVP